MAGNRSCKCVTLVGLLRLGVFCSTIVLINQWFGNPLKRQILSILAPGCSLKSPLCSECLQLTIQKSSGLLCTGCMRADHISTLLLPFTHCQKYAYYNFQDIDGFEEVDAISSELQKIIDADRRTVHSDMIGYPYPNGKYNISAAKLEDLVIERNGIPIRSVVVSYYRSGSSFLGDIIRSQPGNFHLFEPLRDLGFGQIRGPPLATNALKTLRSLFNCEYADLDHYINYDKMNGHLFYKGTYLWGRCGDYNDMCYNKTYLRAFCKLFPLQSMKLVRLRSRAARELLFDENLGVRLVLLVRDPRASLASRKEVVFNNENPEITDPASLCEDLLDDYEISVELQKKYPDRFRVMRYEDLTADPYKQVEELFEFYGRYLHPDVRKFLDTHTKANSDNMFSTFRDTQAVRLHWRTNLEFEEVEEIQRTCATAMKYWGYLPAMNATHLREFNPVANFSLQL